MSGVRKMIMKEEFLFYSLEFSKRNGYSDEFEDGVSI